MNHSPIIIIGMHRSGTTLTSDLLEQLGLFIGNNKDPNFEPYFFIRLNNFILRTAGTAWDNPTPLTLFWKNADLVQAVQNRIETTLNSVASVSYYGIFNYLKKCAGKPISSPWGWKDPRNTLTLPLWLELFPKAKIIHITRHGIDVAKSLQLRSLHELSSTQQRTSLRQQLILSTDLTQPIISSSRCLNIEEGIQLWDEYMSHAEKNTAPLKDRVLTIRYEQLLSHPEELIPQLATFCSLDYNEPLIDNVCRNIRKERSFAYLEDPQLADLAVKHQQLLARHGY